jgi:aspartyl-tRNA(Asn)/glutamyl-tRNA(Gln) amidotransferase subunit A
MYLCDVFTVSVNMAGLPALSLPCGNVSAFCPEQSERRVGGRGRGSKIEGLPVGLQIIGKPFEEEKILDIAQIFEQMN